MKHTAIVELFFCSSVHSIRPNLVLHTTETAKGRFYSVGVWNYSSTTGRAFVEPIEGFDRLTQKELILKIKEHENNQF